jgi:cytochrome P450
MYNLSLAENRHIQKRLCDEILENKAKDVEELRYIEAVIMEGLRLWPAIPMTQPRVVPKGGVVLSGSGDSKGWFLGQGVVVGAQAWSVHRLNEDVFPEAEKFRPERWLDKERRSEMEKCFLAFGMGSRGCTGRS